MEGQCAKRLPSTQSELNREDAADRRYNGELSDSVGPGDVIEVSNDGRPALMLQMLVMYKTLTDAVLVPTDVTELLMTQR